ncbi:mCG145187, partial [Mus musculus]
EKETVSCPGLLPGVALHILTRTVLQSTESLNHSWLPPAFIFCCLEDGEKIFSNFSQNSSPPSCFLSEVFCYFQSIHCSPAYSHSSRGNRFHFTLYLLLLEEEMKHDGGGRGQISINLGQQTGKIGWEK